MVQPWSHSQRPSSLRHLQHPRLHNSRKDDTGGGNGGKFVHGILDDPGQGIVIFVDGFTSGKIDIRILGGAANGWAIRA